MQGRDDSGLEYMTTEVTVIWKWIQDVFCKMGDGTSEWICCRGGGKEGIEDDSEDFSLGIGGS